MSEHSDEEPVLTGVMRPVTLEGPCPDPAAHQGDFVCDTCYARMIVRWWMESPSSFPTDHGSE